jgi:uncharacterized protein YjbI with pentapeptide repeats
MTKIVSAPDSVPFKLDLHGAFLRRTDLSRANLTRANLARADFTNAIFRGADFKDAILDGTVLRGADLTDATNLTSSQLRKAILDETTILPEGLSLRDAAADREQVNGP